MAEHVNKTRILTLILKYLNGNKVLRAKIPTKNVLKRQILTNSIAKANSIALCFFLSLNYLILSRSMPPLNFSDLHSYSTEISSQNKLFKCVWWRKKQQKVLNAKFPARNVLKWLILTTDFISKLWGLGASIMYQII